MCLMRMTSSIQHLGPSAIFITLDITMGKLIFYFIRWFVQVQPLVFPLLNLPFNDLFYTDMFIYSFRFTVKVLAPKNWLCLWSFQFWLSRIELRLILCIRSRPFNNYALIPHIEKVLIRLFFHIESPLAVDLLNILSKLQACRLKLSIFLRCLLCLL